MHPVDMHKNAVAFANQATFVAFGVHGPYEPGSKEHSYWLDAFDREMLTALHTTSRYTADTAD